MPELSLWKAPRPLDGYTRLLDVLTAYQRLVPDDALSDRPLTLVLTPDQMTFQVEQALFQKDRPGSLTLQVYSFKRLAWRVFQLLGGSERLPLTSLGQRLIVARAIHRHGEKLLTLKRALKTRGLLDKISRLFNEFRHYSLEPEALLKVRTGLADEDLDDMFKQSFAAKLEDLYLLYQDVHGLLEDAYLDHESTLKLLAEKIPEYVSKMKAVFFVLGFSSFTPEERSVLGALMQHAERVNILLNGYSTEGTHPEIVRTEQKLLELAEKLNVPVHHEVVPLDVNQSAGPLYTLWASTRAPLSHAVNGRTPSTVEVSEGSQHVPEVLQVIGRDRAEQYERIAFFIRREVRRGRKFRDFAIITGRIETDGEVIERIFGMLDIPVFMDKAEEMRHHPLMRFLTAWLEQLADGELDTPLLIDMLKTGLLTEQLGTLQKTHATDMVEMLENFCLSFGVRGRDWWIPYFGFKDETARKKSTPFEMLRQALTDALRPLMERRRQKEASAEFTGRTWALAIWETLSVMNVGRVLARWMDEAAAEGDEMLLERHEQAWNGLVDVLDEFVEALGDVPMEGATFAEIMLSAVDALTFKTIPQTVDAVVVASFEQSRMLPVPVLIFANAIFGELPPSLNDDGLLLEAERSYLLRRGLELAPDVHEAVDILDGRFLEWLGTAREQIVFASFTFDESGERASPAPVLDMLKHLFPGHAVLDVAWYDAMTPRRAFRELIRLRHQANDARVRVETKEATRAEGTRSFSQVLEKTLLAIPETRHLVEKLREQSSWVDVRAEIPEELARALFGQPPKLSATYLESFYSCPYLFWARYGLGLEERKVFKINRLDTGVLYHETLKNLGRSLAGADLKYRELSLEEIEKRASRLLLETSMQPKYRIFSHDARHQSMLSRLSDVVERASRAYFAHLKKSHFVPQGFEQPIRYTLVTANPKVPEIVLEGQVDRYDVAVIEGKPYIRLIDYKSSQYDWRWPYIAGGLRLQLLLYLLTFLKEHPDMRPAAVLYLPVQDQIERVNVPPDPDDAEQNLSRRFLDKYRARGLLTADEKVLLAMDTTLEKEKRSPYLPVEFTSKGKDGKRSFHNSRSSVLDEKDWMTLTAFVEEKIIEAGEQIISGQFTPSPYRERSGSALSMPCQHCPYQGVCRFEPDQGLRLVRPLSKTKDQALDVIKTKAERQMLLSKEGMRRDL
ncbi:MAG: PD-(D/E)XK nuclease family protein [Candidatus Carbobacillus altaicus]|nr:PD-(D/E)XK nuclease family protein [Candidatus Carbobacillus altaicus]